MSLYNTVYELTETGLLAKNSDSFQKLSPAIVGLLNQNSIIQHENTGELPNEHLNWLLLLGLIKKNSRNLSSKEPTKNITVSSIKSIKQEFVNLIKKDLCNHEKYWDILMNLEIVNDKDGLLWFMNQITKLSESPNLFDYQSLFKKLSELEND